MLKYAFSCAESTLFVFLILFSLSVAAAADGGEYTPAPAQKGPQAADLRTSEHKSSGGYCGIYCLYAAMKLADKNVDYRKLLKPEYVGSLDGSSLAELKKAAEDHGMCALPLTKLTTWDLRRLRYSVILHVKLAGDRKAYDHYVLFLRTKDGRAWLFDPPQPPRVVPFCQLAPIWDGTGLVVSATPIDAAAVFHPAYKRFVLWSCVVVAITALYHLAKWCWPLAPGALSRNRLFVLSLAQCAGITVVSVIWAVTYHFANDEGLLANPSGTASVQRAHMGSFIPKVSHRKVRAWLNSGTVLIDARYERDFQAGHLEGALNLPVNATDAHRRKTTADIPKHTRIVVYCQSKRCKFAESVAIELMDDGFHNVFVFRGGWSEWVAKTTSLSRQAIHTQSPAMQDGT